MELPSSWDEIRPTFATRRDVVVRVLRIENSVSPARFEPQPDQHRAWHKGLTAHARDPSAARDDRRGQASIELQGNVRSSADAAGIGRRAIVVEMRGVVPRSSERTNAQVRQQPPLVPADHVERVESGILRKAPTTRSGQTQQIAVHLPIATGFDPNEESSTRVAGNPHRHEKISRDQATFDAITATPTAAGSDGSIDGQSGWTILGRKRPSTRREKRHGCHGKTTRRTRHRDQVIE
jgi:hypothetical protein